MQTRLPLNLGLLFFGITSAMSGLTLQIKYHMHHQPRLVTDGWDYPTWLLLHKVASVGLLALVTAHLIVNWKWCRITWTKRLFHKHKQLVTLSVIFLTAALTGMGAWALGAFNIGFPVERLVVEIHDKLTLGLTILLALHVWSRRRRLSL